jgi:hypothetical protein
MSEPKRHDSRTTTVRINSDEIRRILKESEHPPVQPVPLRNPSDPPRVTW